MLSKSQKKLIASMSRKKYREEHGLFLAEGDRVVLELISGGMIPSLLLCKSGFSIPPLNKTGNELKALVVSSQEFESLSLLKTPQNAIAVFPLPRFNLNNSAIKDDLVLVLDGIQDPGNLGTIIRGAAWFGIGDIICSLDTADAFSPKVVQATMGALSRVRVHYTDLISFLPGYIQATGNEVYGTFLGGENIHEAKLINSGLLVMGNEGNGIRVETARHITKRLTIPGFPVNCSPTMSLNVGVATAIACAEFRRRLH